MTQTELALRMQCALSTVSRWCSTTWTGRKPSFMYRLSLRSVLQLSERDTIEMMHAMRGTQVEWATWLRKQIEETK